MTTFPVIFAFLFATIYGTTQAIPGGLGDVKLANENTQKLVNFIHDDVEKQLGQNLVLYEAIAYRTQVVAGTMVYVKVHVGDQDYIHVKLIIPLGSGHMPKLLSVQANKAKHDPIRYF